jgi:hypothetical protein
MAHPRVTRVSVAGAGPELPQGRSNPLRLDLV